MTSEDVTSRDIIQKLGGVPAVADAMGVKPNAVWAWVAAGRFPPHTYFRFRDCLAEIGEPAPDELWMRRGSKQHPTRDADLPQTVSAHA